MASLRTISPQAGSVVLAAMLLVGSVGCTQTGKLKNALPTTITESLKITPSNPPTQLICLWQRRLASLPDPVRDGVIAPGLVGQAFLITADNQPAEVHGDMIIMMSDETKRSGNAGKMVDEVYLYDAATLRKLITNDERFGKSIALFLPWPSHWKDVNAVRIQVRYKQKGTPDLYAGEANIALDFSTTGTPVWTEIENGKLGNAGGGLELSRPTVPNLATRETRGVPDVTNLMKVGGITGPAQTNLIPTQTNPILPVIGTTPALPSSPGAPAPAVPVTSPISGPLPPSLPGIGEPQAVLPSMPIPPPPPASVPEVPLTPTSTPLIPIAPPTAASGAVPPLPNSGEITTVTIPR